MLLKGTAFPKATKVPSPPLLNLYHLGLPIVARRNGQVTRRPSNCNIFREEATSALAGFHAGPLSWSNWNLEMLVFVEGGKPENPEKSPRSKAHGPE